MVFVTLAVVLCCSIAIQQRWNYPPAPALLLAVSAISLVLFGAALAGVLWWAALLVHAAGITLAGMFLMRWARHPRPFPVPVPYGMLCLLSALFWLVHHGSQYFYYDEFGHWAIYLKDLLATDSLWGAETNARHPRYVPGAPLWQYLFSVFAQRTDATAYFGQFVLFMTPLTLLWHGLRWRDVGWILGVLALSVILVANFSLGAATLYVDHVVACWFAGIILAALVFGTGDKGRSLLVLGLPLATLALIKEVGLPFALAAASILAALQFRRSWRPGTGIWPAGGLAGIALVLLLIPAVVSTALWEWDRNHSGVPDSQVTVTGLAADALSDDADSSANYRVEISRRFIEVLLHQQISRNEVSTGFNAFTYPLRELYQDRFRLTMFSLLGLFVLWQLILFRFLMPAEARWDWAIAGAGLTVTAIAYLYFVFRTYVHSSGEYGLLLSSFVRYSSAIALPIMIMSFAALLPRFRAPATVPLVPIGRYSVSAPALTFLAGLVALAVFETPHLVPILQQNPRIEMRSQTAPVTQAIHEVAGAERVWVYLPNDQPNEIIGRFLQFQMSPTPVSVERSESFMSRSDAEIVESWRPYGYIWFPMQSVDDDARLQRLAGSILEGRLFRVSGDVEGVSIAPVELSF